MATNKFPVARTYEEISADWEKVKTLDFRYRLKTIKRIHFDIINTKEELTLESALFYINLLKDFQPYDTDGGTSATLSKLIPAYLKIAGYEHVEIIREVKSRDLGKAGNYVIGDAAFAEDANNNEWSFLPNKDLMNMMNKGNILAFETEDCYLGKARFRLIKAHEPLLSEKEYKKLQRSTPTLVISIKSGSVCILNTEDEEKLEMNLEPGNYKICAYKMGRGWNFLIVMCKTDMEATNDIKYMLSLRDI